MSRFIIVTFLFLCVAYYQLSGGSDFTPEARAVEARVASAQPASAAEAPLIASLSPARDPASQLEVSKAQVVPAVATTEDVAASPGTVPARTLSAEQFANIAPVFTSLSQSPQGSGGDNAGAATGAPGLDLATVDASRLNVRSGPSTNDGVVDQLARGETVSIVDTNGSWTLVRIEGDGIEGWVADRFLIR